MKRHVDVSMCRKLGALIVGAGLLACSQNGDPVEPLDSEAQAFSTCGSNCSSWVYPSSFDPYDLIYVPDDEGDRIPEFGRVGYKRSNGGLLSETAPPMGQPNRTIGNANPPLAAPFAADPPLVTASGAGICDGTATSPAHQHGQAIQAAINQLRALAPDANGVRGRVYLSRGHYAIWNRLIVPDGIVLSGVSQWSGTSGPPTTLHACGPSEDPLITIDEGVTRALDAPFSIQDEIVPVGSNSVVLTTSSVTAGSRVLITRFSPWTWLEDISMKYIVRLSPDETCPRSLCTMPPDQYCANSQACVPSCCNLGWKPGERDLVFERTVTHVETVDTIAGQPPSWRVFFDQPFTNALERKYGPHTLAKYQSTSAVVRARNSGVESLRGVSHQTSTYVCPEGSIAYCGSTPLATNATTSCNEFDELICNGSTEVKCKAPDGCDDGSSLDDEGNARCLHSLSFISIKKAEDVWVEGVIAEGFSKNAVGFAKESRQVTAEDVRSIDPIGPLSGGWRYTLHNSGEGNLIVGAQTEDGRHDFMLGATVTGPNAFVDCTATDARSDSGTHHRWATGTLFDRVKLTAPPNTPVTYAKNHGRLVALNRTAEGSGHGWTGANIVVFNSEATMFNVFNPPTAQNWLIGSTGPLGVADRSEVDDCPESLNESNPHFDFKDSAEHGTNVALNGNSSLFLSASAGWRRYLSGASQVEQRQYFVGDADDFGTKDLGVGGDTNDIVYVNPAFRQWVETESVSGLGVPIKGFDDTQTDRSVPFTIRFDLAPNEEVVHAYLTVRLKRTTWTQDSFHRVHLAGVNFGSAGTSNRVSYFWRCTDNSWTGTCSPIPTDMTGPAGWPTNTTSPVVRVLDLGGSLQGSSGPRFMNQTVTDQVSGRRYGELNVNFFKRTSVDWAALTLIVRRTA